MKKLSLILNLLTVAGIIFFAIQTNTQSTEISKLKEENGQLAEQAIQARNEAQMNEAEAMRQSIVANQQRVLAEEALENCQKKK